MKTAPTDNPWNLDAELNLRAAAFARRAQLTSDEVVELAVADFFFANAERWREALSNLASLALMDLIGLHGCFLAARRILSRPKEDFELPNNRWNLPPFLQAAVTAVVADADITHDDLLVAALRGYLHRPFLEEPHRQARATLVAFALSAYLEEREPPPRGTRAPSAAGRPTEN